MKTFIEFSFLFSQITDFLTYEKSDDQFKILILTTADSTVPSIGGDKIIVYTCEILTEFHTRAICIIDLTQPFKMLYHHRSNKPLGILGVPTLSKQLHQMEVQVNQIIFYIYE